MKLLSGLGGDAVVLMADTRDPVVLERAQALPLQRDERRRVARLRSPARRDSFLVAHQLLREALGPGVLVEHSPTGALSCRLAGKAVGVSLSHTGTTVIAAIRPDGPCGVDAEAMFTPRRAELVAPWVLASEELPSGPGADPARTTLAWVVKEALAKASGLDLADVWRVPVLHLQAPGTLELGDRRYRVTSRQVGRCLVALASCLTPTHATSAQALPSPIPAATKGRS